MKHAVVLVSGGLDSATVLAIARSQGHETYALSFDYGQRHKIELESAHKIAKSLGAREHRVVKIDNSLFHGSALTREIDVPKDRSELGAEIPVTYVPARNTIFLAHALAWALMRSTTAVIPIAGRNLSPCSKCSPTAGRKRPPKGCVFKFMHRS